MSACYQETIAGENVLRPPPGDRHEAICIALHEAVLPSLAGRSQLKLLPPRDVIQTAPNTVLRPDLCIVSADSGKPWLIAEVIDSADHHTDTVDKKEIYEDLRLPRLWMIDPRYDNVEIYRASTFGIALVEILYQKNTLTEAELPAFQLPLRTLFAG